MDLFPPEFILHLHPLLHVGGLDEHAQWPPFAQLAASLRKAFSTKRSFQAWDNSRGAHCDFHTVLVDKTARFPARKASGAGAGHSPLSPLAPGSPLYPDGLMAPVWIRKHRDLIPAAFVQIHRLWEASMDETLAPLDPLAPDATATIQDREKQADADLVAEIVERKRLTAERGIKLAVVLLTSRRMLDEPTLDARLSLIRRQSSLDSRASLFVISPVAPAEVQTFVYSLQSELYEGVVDYYREHGRRARRKRSRVPTHVSRPIGATAGPLPLGPQAWSVRYDFKMAVFAEMRQEVEVSLKHYEDCYEGLLDLFHNSANALPPRSKRWLEVKVLADCINAKICKFYMYTEEPDRVVAQQTKHIARFRDLCNSWQIGEDTFEYWSWLSKQHRLFADQLDTAIRCGYRMPDHRPPPSQSKQVVPPLPPGGNPATALMHPGFAYYRAAQCAVERKVRFKAIESAENGMNGSAEPKPVISRAIEHERQVKHDEQIIELYTKAYDCFKRFKAGRMSLFVAAAIAGVHFEAEAYGVALRFFERIAKTYRKEEWRSILESILHQSYVAARQQQDVPAATKLAVELLALGPASPDYAIDVERGLTPVFAVMPAPEGTPTITLEDTSFAVSLFNVRVAFWRASALLGEKVPFQLVVEASPSLASKSLTFASMRIKFGEGVQSFEVQHGDEGDENVARMVDLSDGTTRANLTWTPGSRRIFTGSLTLDVPVHVRLHELVLMVAANGWQVEVPLKPTVAVEDTEAFARLTSDYIVEEDGALVTLPSRGSQVVEYTPRTLAVRSETQFSGPAYLGEHFPIRIEVVNEDVAPSTVACDLLLHPAENESDLNQIIVSGLPLEGSTHRLELGEIRPGQAVQRTVVVRCIGLPGLRMLDVSVNAQPAESDAEGAITPLANERLHSLSFDVVHPVTCSFNTQYRHDRLRPTRHRGVGDLTRPDRWDDAVDVLLSARLEACGPWDLTILEMTLDLEVDHPLSTSPSCVADPEQTVPTVRKVDETLDDADLPMRWGPEDAFGVSYRVEVAVEPPGDETGFLTVKWRRLSAPDDAPASVTFFPLPILAPPIAIPRAIVSLPAYVVQHEPTDLCYTLLNPSLTRPLRASVHVEGGDPWAFSGPRRTAPFLVLPNSEHVIRLTVVATAGAGPIDVPLVRILEHLPTSSDEQQQSPMLGDEETPLTRTREVPIVADGAPGVRPRSVFVVPQGARPQV